MEGKMNRNFNYDSFGNPYSEFVSSNNITKTVSRRMTDAKTYQFTYPDGKIIRKTATGSDLDSIEYNNSEIASYSRANGVLTAITKGQNLTETFTYNNWNMLDNHTVSNANADVYDMTYGYSRGWHLVEKADGIKNTSDKYAYDSYYRLKEVKYDFANNTAARTDNFYQDGVHNIEQSTENGVTFAWGVDKLNRLREKKVGNNTESAYEYDERNNMIKEYLNGHTTPDIKYFYDDLNRLIEVQDGSQNTIAKYTYDAFNRRITKTVGNTTERYTYDDWNIVEISTNSDPYTNIIDAGTDRHIAIEVTANNTSTLYYFLTDERGNVTALTDANGNILERYRYRVYGDFEILDTQFTPKNCNNQTCYATNLHNFLWGGSLYEPETGLYWMRNRYYHPDMHRFINQDPIGIWGDANNLGNGFAYVAGMVIEASDPTGLISQENSYDIILNTDEEFYQVRQMTAEERKQSINWMSNVAFNIAWPIVFGNPVGLGIGIAATLLTIMGDLDNTNHSFTFVVSLTLSRSEEYYSIINTLKVANKSYSYKLLVAGLVKDAIFLGFDLHSLYKDNNVPSENSLLNENLDSDKLKTLLLDNGDIVIADENGKIVHCSGDCSSTPEGSYLDADLLKTLWGIYPSDPYEDVSDMIQNIIRINILTKMLKRGENEQPPFFTDTSTGPNGAIKIYKNPYYVNKDPLKMILFDGDNGSGKPVIYRNPFVPGAEYGYDATTYEKFQQAGFPQTNVDPYSNLQQGAGFIQTNVDPYFE